MLNNLKKYLLLFFLATTTQANTTLETKPCLWVYWQNINGATTMPAHIALCRKTLHKHCDKSFNIMELDEKTIYNYLPELKKLELEFNLDRLQIAQKVDFYRAFLLQKHGGLYLDSDMIVMKDLKEVTDKLIDYDYVGFGQYNQNRITYNSYGAPQNWAMASRKEGILVTSLLENMLQTLRSTNNLDDKEYKLKLSEIGAPTQEKNALYHAMGKCLLQATLKPLLEKGYSYYHYSTDIDGTRDIYGKYVTMADLFSAKRINYKDPKNFLVVTLYNYYISRTPTRKNMSEQELLNENTNFARFMKQSLELETKTQAKDLSMYAHEPQYHYQQLFLGPSQTQPCTAGKYHMDK